MKKILVIDDEEALRNTLKIHLRSANYDVVTANNCQDGINLATSATFDLVLCDLKLPDKSGVEFIKAMKEKGINVPVIAVSGFIDLRIIEEVKLAGAVEYLAKPFLKQSLLSLLDKVLMPVKKGEAAT